MDEVVAMPVYREPCHPSHHRAKKPDSGARFAETGDSNPAKGLG